MTRAPRILVTGAGGFIGSALCRRLDRSSADVAGTVRAGRSAAATVAVPAADDASPRVAVDLTRREDCAALVAEFKPDCVFHLASLVTGSRELEAVPGTFDANLASTVYLMEAAVEAGTRRFVVAGSIEEPDAGAPPRSPYAASKAAARMYAGVFARSGKLDVRHARLAMIYGPGQVDRSKLVPHTIDALVAGRAPRIASGTRLADWTHLDDAVDALVTLAALERPPAEIATQGVEIGTGRSSSVREVVERLAELHAQGIVPHFGARPDRAHECVRPVDAERARRSIGWRARIGLADGLAQTWRAETGGDGTPAHPRFQTTTGSVVSATP